MIKLNKLVIHVVAVPT